MASVYILTGLMIIFVEAQVDPALTSMISKLLGQYQLVCGLRDSGKVSQSFCYQRDPQEAVALVGISILTQITQCTGYLVELVHFTPHKHLQIQIGIT